MFIKNFDITTFFPKSVIRELESTAEQAVWCLKLNSKPPSH